MKLWSKVIPYDDKFWYKDGEYIPTNGDIHAEYVVLNYLDMGFDDTWKDNLCKKYGINSWDDLVSHYDDNDDFVLPLDEEYSDLQNVLITEALKKGYIRIWNMGTEFSIECVDIIRNKNQIKRIVEDTYPKPYINIYDYSSGLSVSGDSNTVLEVLDGKSSDGAVSKYDDENRQYVYYSTLREGLK